MLEFVFNKFAGLQALKLFFTEHLRWILQKIFLAQPTCPQFLCVAYYFVLPEAILNAINTALKKMWIQCKLHLLLG